MVRIRDIVLVSIVLGVTGAAVVAKITTGWPHLEPDWLTEHAVLLVPALLVLFLVLLGFSVGGDNDDGDGFGLDIDFGSSGGSSWGSSDGSSSGGFSGGATGSW